MKTYLLSLLLFFGGVTRAQTIDDYLTIAAKNNPGLKAKYAEFEASLHRIRQQRALPDPTLSVSAFGNMIETRVGPQQAVFILNQSFPWFGTLRSQGNVMAAKSEVLLSQWLEAKNALFYDVRLVWYSLYEAEQAHRYQLENMAVLEQYRSLALSRMANGKGNMTDVLRVELKLEAVKSQLTILKDKRQSLVTQFNALLNRNPEEEVVTFQTSKVPEQQKSFSIDSVISRNPRLMAVEQQYEALLIQQELVKKQGMPKLGIGLNYTIIGKRTDMNVANNGQDAIMPMISFSLPIYRKKYRAMKAEVLSMQQTTELTQVAIQNDLLTKHSKAIFDLQSAKLQFDLSEKQVDKTDRIANLLLTDYQNDKAGMEELLSIQQQLLEYKLAAVTALKNYHVAEAALIFLTSNDN